MIANFTSFLTERQTYAVSSSGLQQWRVATLDDSTEQRLNGDGRMSSAGARLYTYTYPRSLLDSLVAVGLAQLLLLVICMIMIDA
jgi:hypothetical protein